MIIYNVLEKTETPQSTPLLLAMLYAHQNAESEFYADYTLQK
jgi:hypothetical protein